MADGPTNREPLPIDPALLELPPGYSSTGDPVEGNPFPPGTPRHQLWASATRIAEEKSARLKSDWLASGPLLRQAETIEEMERDIAVYRERNRELLGLEFDVWAWRAARVVLTDSDVLYMDSWLVGYAGACLEGNARLMFKHGLPTHTVEGEVRWMRVSLASRVSHWKAENRRCRAIREEEARQFREADSRPPGDVVAAPVNPETPAGPILASIELCSIGTAADTLGVHEDTLRRMEKKGTIKIVRIGKRLQVPVAELLRLTETGDYPKRTGK